MCSLYLIEANLNHAICIAEPSAVLTFEHVGQLPRGSTSIGGPMLIYECCVRHVFNV
jgi:hypothetical protein